MIIVDIEATCWEHNATPPGEQSEIIEIGVCLLDPATGEIDTLRSLMIKPTRSKISPFCTKLTTITPAMVADGMSFADACAVLEQNYGAKTRLWASWGNYDRRMFESQCSSFAVPYPFGERHLNLKERYADLMGLPRRVGMAAALRASGLTLHGTHHRGADDAYNIARITAALCKRWGVEVVVGD